MTAVPLSTATLKDLPEGVRTPRYDRGNLTAGMVHIGLGNFHRAHQAWYLHRLMDEGLAQDWAIVGAGVRPSDSAQRDRLLSQDCLTTLIELSPTETSAEVIGSMIDFLPVEDDNASLIARMAEPDIRIVSLTVTEGGYYRTSSGRFDSSHDDIRRDATNPASPCTAFGAIVAALKLRRDAGLGPFSCMSCDNLQGNGAILRDTVVSLARLTDGALADWIDANCTFPNSMVDCIVPATGPKELELARNLGIADAAPVTHENFRQWVIEDDFCAGRPDWDRTGATFSDSVHAYETMKIRMLNAGHQLLANAGELLSIETISGCMEDPAVRAFFEKVELDEIAPLVAAVPGMTPVEYARLIGTRFANPAIVDTTRRVAFDGSSRHTGFVHPTIRDRLERGLDVEGLALAEALWARMCIGIREDGTEIVANDPHWEALRAAAREAKTRPPAWLEQPAYDGLRSNEAFAAPFCAWLERLETEGTRSVLTAFASQR
ncbi:mannitol dehydrogenase family protein [Histidinibacterium aquaticum]|uniref:Mannitol dehydrogenase family protein n=1 Tax=Histidinibacterium aquaticum TaxID=2613962 RepID=A0A5J5GN21_9RHOB|nr:mannitol dehydrogenase family protein [Histidinibacterium aquaticum]KAA9009447.1 mannitol dehydrogenase family protein [Histidinibacterium aquaticum]